VYEQGDPLSIWTLTLPEGGGGAERQQLLGGAGAAYHAPVVSPDGRWIAYVSTESGAPQVSVRAFPILGGRVTVSVDGGDQPRWSRDGRELFFLSPRNQVMVSEVRSSATTFNAGPAHELLAAAEPFDVDPNGQRFLILTSRQPEQLYLVTNWFQDVKRLVEAR